MSSVLFYNPDSTVVPGRVTNYIESVNTPDYTSEENTLINPDLSNVSGIAQEFWKVLDGTVVEMDSSDKSNLLPGERDSQKIKIDDSGSVLIANRYRDDRHSISALYADSERYRPNRRQYLQDYVDWVGLVEDNVSEKADLVDDATTIEGVRAISLDSSTLLSQAPNVTAYDSIGISDDTSLASFLDENAVVTDSTSGISGPYWMMELLNHRKDLYNDSTNPLYDADHTSILGDSGLIMGNSNRVLSLENIHAKLGYHNQEVQEGIYTRPKELLIYYGWPNSFNSSQNSWNNELVAQDMATYDLVVLGSGLEDPSHGDYANTKVVIPRIKSLNPATKVFGYVTVDQDYGDFTGKVNQWGVIGGVDGIFMDEAGYDFGKTRSEFNQRVDYVHDRTSMNTCFANAWNTNHILGTENDPSYPNSTYNDSSAESNLTNTDWILLESFPINTTSYSSSDGHESASDWASRGVTMQSLRDTYGVNFASAGIIDNDTTLSGDDLFKFGYVSALMWSLEAYGTSDDGYAASSAAVTRWTRPSISDVGPLWNLNASVQQDNADSDKYHRYAQNIKFTLDFSSGAQDSTYWIR